MGLKLNATNGGGSVELDVPDTVSSDLALTVPAAAGTIDRLERAGNVLQVVFTDFTSSGITVISTALTSYQDTNCTASITPQRSDSNILVITHNQVQANAFNGGNSMRLERNGTTGLYPDTTTGGLFHYSSGNDLGTDTLFFLDTTGSWSGAQTYLLQFKGNGNGSAYTAAFSMTLMEIAA